MPGILAGREEGTHAAPRIRETTVEVMRGDPPVPSPGGTNRIVQWLWVGSELSMMEQLSISSFLLNGHEYHLYVYGETRNVPLGTVI